MNMLSSATWQAVRRTKCHCTASPQSIRTSATAKAKTETDPHPERASEDKAQETAAERDSTKKTQAQLDEELQQKMSDLSGDGGESGVEYEGGQPVSMKRSVKNNMFRYI